MKTDELESSPTPALLGFDDGNETTTWQEGYDDAIVCERCGGEGRVPVHEYDAQMDEMWRTCPDCHGTVEGCAR